MSHSDIDYEDLRRKADALTLARLNKITAGAANEVPELEERHGFMSVTKMPDDEHGILRISIGGNTDSAYVVFRGDRQQCVNLLQCALQRLDDLQGEPQ